MKSPESYWDFIKRIGKENQDLPVELHHLRSQHNYPELKDDSLNHLNLSRINHDYATLLQCWEEDYPLLCPWQANRLSLSHPHLESEIQYWLSRKGLIQSEHIRHIDNSHFLTLEVCSAAGSKSWSNKTPEERKSHMENMRSKIDHKSRTDKLVRQENFMGKQPWWHRYVGGKLERKRGLIIPEGEGWVPGKGDSYTRRRVRCTLTGHEGTQSSLARWQKNRGIDTSNREFIGELK
jgi:hypothetical protein